MVCKDLTWKTQINIDKPNITWCRMGWCWPHSQRGLPIVMISLTYIYPKKIYMHTWKGFVFLSWGIECVIHIEIANFQRLIVYHFPPPGCPWMRMRLLTALANLALIGSGVTGRLQSHAISIAPHCTALHLISPSEFATTFWKPKLEPACSG